MVNFSISLSIITAHLNDINGLLKTYKSIKSQSFKNWNWIIIDSFTNQFFDLIPQEIIDNKNIIILQCQSSIYDAMNIGILNVKTDYFHFLNCNSTYNNQFALEKVINSFKNNSDNRKKIIAAQLIIENYNGTLKVQKNNKFLYPFKSGHESTLFPNINKNKILLKSYLGVTADIFFMNDYANFFNIIFPKIAFVNYPKGGFSDSKKLFFDKFIGYIKLLFSLFFNLRIIAFLYCIYRLVALINEIIKANFFSLRK